MLSQCLANALPMCIQFLVNTYPMLSQSVANAWPKLGQYVSNAYIVGKLLTNFDPMQLAVWAVYMGTGRAVNGI